MGIPAAVYYPGLAQIQSATITMGHGITPNGFQLVIAPQPSNQVVEIGDLTLEYDNQTLVIPGCKVDSASFSFDESGNLISVSLQDRRWKWRYGTISGEYNIRRPDGTIRKQQDEEPGTAATRNSEFTPHELARLCMEAAREEIEDDAFSDMPNDVRPYVRWDVSNPMAELSNLAELLGCRVVLGLDNKVRIRKVNQGRELPTDYAKRFGSGYDFDSGPDVFVVVSAPYRFQLDMSLRAVGLDVDGVVKPVDELSYKPETPAGATAPGTSAWQFSDPYTSHAFTDNETTSNLAVKSVFKWYEVEIDEFPSPTDDIFPIPITDLQQIVLLPSQTFKEPVNGEWQEKDATVYGLWFEGRDFSDGNVLDRTFSDDPSFIPYNAPSDSELLKQIVRQSWSLDTEACIVRFGEPITLKCGTAAADAGYVPAKLILRTSCYVKDEKTFGLVRAEYERVIRSKPNPVRHYILREDIKPYLYGVYGEEMDPPETVEIRRNDAECRAQAEYYLDQAVAEFNRPSSPQDAVYGGWRFDVELDGAIQSITWTLSATSSDGPLTRIERNHDTGGSIGIPYKLKRSAEKQAEATRKQGLADFRKREEQEIAKAGKGLF